MPRIRAFPLHAFLQTRDDSPDFQETCADLYDTLTMHVQDREQGRQKAELEAQKLACPRDA